MILTREKITSLFHVPVTNVTALQVIQVIRFGIFLLINIVLAKSFLSTGDIGIYETVFFITGAFSFFWVNGIIQSLLPLYSNNNTFGTKKTVQERSPELFNAFILITFFTLLAFLTVLFGKDIILSKLIKTDEMPYYYLLPAYLFFSSPACLIEYIYLLRNESGRIIRYGITTYLLQFLLTTVPLFFRYPVEYCLWGLLMISFIRWIWLIILLVRYAQFSFSFPFIKEHLMLGFPLIVSAFLSGSASYINGFIISERFDQAGFAVFRYGAREFPLALLLAVALSNAMLSELNTIEKVRSSVSLLKQRSLKLMHYLFPVTIVFILCSNWLFPVIFNENFRASAKVFNIFLLLIITRMVFPHTILIAMKRTPFHMLASCIEIIINVAFSLILVRSMGITGVAFATFIAYAAQQLLGILYNYYVFGIRPAEYIPIRAYSVYSLLTVASYILSDFILFA